MLSDDTYEAQHADARTLVTLLHLRDMQEKLGESYSIVTEMNDDANREVAEVTKADDFVVSTKLISLYLTQLSENRQLAEVFAALFDPEGAEIHLKPAANYLRPETPTNFATIVEAAARRGETAIGYRRHDEVRQPPQYGITLNPDKAAPLTLGGRRSGHRAGRHLSPQPLAGHVMLGLHGQRRVERCGEEDDDVGTVGVVSGRHGDHQLGLHRPSARARDGGLRAEPGSLLDIAPDCPRGSLSWSAI